MKLNVDQQAAAEHAGNLLLVAPPGSGKSGTLVQRARRILTDSPRHRVGLLTFTDAATTELRERLHKSMTPEMFKRVSVSTFHKHCMNQLRASNSLGKLLGPTEVPTVINRAISACGEGMMYEDALAAIEKAKVSLSFTGKESPLVAAYEEQRLRYRASDLWDVVREAVVGMQNGSVRPLDVTHLLGDEWQDADRLQQEWILLHAARGVEVTVVGDDDQSIYGWRRALGYAGMQEFAERASARIIKLQINYRSNQEILTAAEAVIRNNSERVVKTVLSDKGPGGIVEVIPTATRARECEDLISAIMEDVPAFDDGRIVPPKGRWAVIARTNACFHLLAGAMRSKRIGYLRMSGKDKLPDLARTMCLFLLSLQTGEALGIEGTLLMAQTSDYTLGIVTRGLDGEMYRLLDGEVPDMADAPPEEAKLVASFARLSRKWRAILHTGAYVDVIDAVGEWFIEHIVRRDNDRESLQFYLELLRSTSGSLSTRANRILRDESPTEGNGVALHTMHSAKGLEFDNVALININVGTVPSSKSEAVDEERRLFYVGITRARHDLRIYYQPNKGKSQFIGELERAFEQQVVAA